MSMSVGGGGGALADINVTPLVDVMLVLLIIFMVTAPMIQPVQSKVQLPGVETGQALEPKEKFLTIDVDLQKRLWIGKIPLDLKDLEIKLKHNPKVKQDRKVFLRADRRLKYRFVLRIMVALRRAGVERIGLVTDPSKAHVRIGK